MSIHLFEAGFVLNYSILCKINNVFYLLFFVVSRLEKCSASQVQRFISLPFFDETRNIYAHFQ